MNSWRPRRQVRNSQVSRGLKQAINCHEKKIPLEDNILDLATQEIL